MTDITTTVNQPLVYNGSEIRAKNEQFSLTDMWKAAGADQNRKPAVWLRQDATQRFIEVLASVHGNPEVSQDHFGLVKTGRGGAARGATYAHWQIAIAYAKYLSPEFHMWCNEVVRERMEGRSVSTASLPADVREMIERDHGMIRALVRDVTMVKHALPELAKEMAAQMVEPLVRAELARSSMLVRRGKTAKQIWDEHRLPGKIRGSTVWFGNRLKEMGCCIEDEGRYDRGGSAIRLFDPDKASICMRNGLRQTAAAYAEERLGQTKLRLVA